MANKNILFRPLLCLFASCVMLAAFDVSSMNENEMEPRLNAFVNMKRFIYLIEQLNIEESYISLSETLRETWSLEKYKSDIADMIISKEATAKINLIQVGMNSIEGVDAVNLICDAREAVSLFPYLKAQLNSSILQIWGTTNGIFKLVFTKKKSKPKIIIYKDQIVSQIANKKNTFLYMANTNFNLTDRNAYQEKYIKNMEYTDQYYKMLYNGYWYESGVLSVYDQTTNYFCKVLIDLRNGAIIGATLADDKDAFMHMENDLSRWDPKKYRPMKIDDIISGRYSVGRIGCKEAWGQPLE